MLEHLHIPESSSTISVWIIDNGSLITGMQGSDYMSPVLPGYETFDGPVYCFLLHHQLTNTRLLFDLGIRTDWQTAYPPALVESLKEEGMGLHVERDTTDILREHKIFPSDIAAVIFSHHHFDHTGDMTKFTASTKIIVGPGYREEYLPGYPDDPENEDTTADLYHGRELVELDFSPIDPKVSLIGGFQAYDYFSDGSLYLLSTPGHSTGHLSALARTTSDGQESTFLFLGGDIVSSNGVHRPSEGHPLPDQVQTSSSHVCPGELLARLHRCHASDGNVVRNTPFCLVAGEEDREESQRSADKLRVFDAEADVLVIWAHDGHLKPVLDFFPTEANAWKAKGWKEKGHWRWLDPCIEHVEVK